MTRPAWIVATAIAAALLTGCDLADRLEGKSPGREWHAHRQAMLIAPSVSNSGVSETQPVLTIVGETQPTVPTETAQPEPVVVITCMPQWMVRRCGPDGAEPW